MTSVIRWVLPLPALALINVIFVFMRLPSSRSEHQSRYTWNGLRWQPNGRAAELIRALHQDSRTHPRQPVSLQPSPCRAAADANARPARSPSSTAEARRVEIWMRQLSLLGRMYSSSQ